MFHSERFFCEAWQQISETASPMDAASDVQWIASVAGLAPGDRVTGFAHRGCQTTGVDFGETQLDRARKAAAAAGVLLALVCQDIPSGTGYICP